MIAGRAVHQGEMDTGQGITTVCGKYALAGRYASTDEPITCRVCLRILGREHRD
jgi:hypothetical protein